MLYSIAVFSCHILDRNTKSQKQLTINMVNIMFKFGLKSAVLEQFNFGNTPFILAFWEKDCFCAKSTPIPISNVNYFKTVWRKTVTFLQSKGN